MDRFVIPAALVAMIFAAPAPGQAQTPAAQIDFGDDSNEWAHDGECDDPRFAGSGMALILLDEDIGTDASDCRAGYEAGRLWLRDDPARVPVPSGGMDFGDDSGEYARDGECDDARFTGPGMTTATLRPGMIGTDAADCRAGFEAGLLTLREPLARPTPAQIAAFDFGDDSGEYAHDEECDDPRFEGIGMAAAPLDSAYQWRDASDCRAAFVAGLITLRADAAADARVGSGAGAGAGSGSGSAPDAPPGASGRGLLGGAIGALRRGLAGDAGPVEGGGAGDGADAGAGAPVPSGPVSSAGIEFGHNNGRFANDGECDDRRFVGPGMASPPLIEEDIGTDAADCRAAFEAGSVTLRQIVTEPAFIDGIAFGIDDSWRANDDECDDPRFEGAGMSSVPTDAEDIGRDASDCMTAWRAGSIGLAPGESGDLPAGSSGAAVQAIPAPPAPAAPPAGVQPEDRPIGNRRGN